MGLKYELPSLDEIDESLQQFYIQSNDKYVFDIEGVKPIEEFNKVQGALQKERNDTKALKAKLQAFGELDPTEVQSQLARIAELEAAAAGKFDEAKMEESTNLRVEAKLRPILAEKDQLLAKVSDLENKLGQFEKLETQRSMEAEFKSKMKVAKIDPIFEETILLKAEKLFSKTDDNTFATTDGLFLNFDTWLSQQQTNYPHWWGRSEGGGSRGSGAAGYVGQNPFEGGVFGNVTEQMRLERENPALAAQLKKMAEAKASKR